MSNERGCKSRLSPSCYLNEWISTLIVDLLSGGVDRVDAVEGECLGRCRAVLWVHNRAGTVLGVHHHYALEHKSKGI